MTNRYLNNIRVNDYKLRMGCSLCDFNAIHPSQLHLDHLDRSLKYKTSSGKRVSVSYLIQAGYSWDIVANELLKCRVLCANCHILYTVTEQQPSKKENIL